jgi:lytic murein transglycosylase
MQQGMPGLAAMAGMLAAAVFTEPASAQCRNSGSFERWLEGFRQEASAQGISRATLSAALDDVTFDPDIIRRDRGQGVFSQTFLQFAGRMADGYRVGAGAKKLQQHHGLLARIEQRFGVPPAVLVAFWGLETDFGADNGKFPVMRSLATLAYDCRRPDMFRAELLYALKVIQRGDIAPHEMVGAWAGEIGQLQFSASSYYQDAVDFDGNGHVDLIRSTPDALATGAQLMVRNGWRRGEPWLLEVRVPENLPWEQADLKIKHPRSQWARWGVTLADGRPLPADAMPASLHLPMGRLGPAFLAYRNFDAFLEWNQSLVYATTAAYLATRLSGAPRVGRGNGNPPSLSAREIADLQRHLQRLGHDVGKIDGKLGMQTRDGVKKAQLKLGLPADSYPTPELLERLRR